MLISVRDLLALVKQQEKLIRMAKKMNKGQFITLESAELESTLVHKLDQFLSKLIEL